MDKSNLFRYAKKELSQDAVICSILSKENDPRALAFLKEMITHNPICSENSIPLPVSFEIVQNSLKQQDGHIDIFLEIRDNSGKQYAVIIEDKTETSMHDQQMTQYIYQKMYSGNYEGCFFVLFKTGQVPFWEKSDYTDEIHSIQQGKLVSGQFVKPKDRTQISNQLSFLCQKAKQIRFSLFERKDFVSFLGRYEWADYPWMTDYTSYISDEPFFQRSQSDIVFQWMINYKGSTTQFAKSLSGGLWERVSLYTPQASGKRNYDCAFEGCCGKTAKRCYISDSPDSELRDIVSIAEVYYLLPIVSFKSESVAKIQLNFHAYQNANHPQGYRPFNEYSPRIKDAYKRERAKIQEELKDQLSRKGWKFSKIKENSLQLCYCDVKYCSDELSSDEGISRSDLKDRVCELLTEVKRIKIE